MTPPSGTGRLHGREELLATISGALRVPGVLVTLTGLPGAGTTSLARAAAAARRGAGLTAPTHEPEPMSSGPVPVAVVEGRRCEQYGALARAVEAAGGAQLLLVEDADRSPEAADVVGDLRRARPELRVLVTSRAPLRLPGEVVVRVPPLPLPDPYAEPESLREEPAVRLYLDVAARTGTTATLHGSALGEVARICRLLGGLPLAIELVAARSAVFSPGALVQLLERTPSRLLRDHGVAAAHDLVSAVRWSHAQLSHSQAALLEALLVFGSPVPIEVIEQVCARPDVMEDLSALVDSHLLEPEHRGTTTRFALPVLVHDVLQEQAGPQSSDPGLLERHLRWATEIAERARTTDDAGRPTQAMTLIAVHEGDLVAALDRASASGDRRRATTLLLGLLPWWFNRGLTREQRHRVAEVLQLRLEVEADRGSARPSPDVAVLAAWQQLVAVELARSPGELQHVVSHLGRQVEQARGVDDQTLLRVLFLAAQASRPLADRTASARWTDEGRRLAERLGDRARLVRFEAWTGMLAHQEGRVDEAARWGRSGLDRARELDDPALILSPAGLLRSLPVRVVVPHDVPRAADLAELARRVGDLRALDWLEPVAAMTALRTGDVAAAARHSSATLRRARVSGSRARVGAPIMCLAMVALHRGEVGWAGRLLGMLAGYLPLLRPSLPPWILQIHDRAVVSYRAAHPEHEVDAALTHGASMGHDEAVQVAISYAAGVGRDPGSSGPPLAVAGLRVGMSSERAAAATLHQEAVTSRLTQREREVLALLTSGVTNREISGQLRISPKTVMHHTSNIYRKLDVRGRTQAAAWDVRHPDRSHD